MRLVASLRLLLAMASLSQWLLLLIWSPTSAALADRPIKQMASNVEQQQQQQQQQQQLQYKLPAWFNFELYKRLFGKRYLSKGLNEQHKRMYLRTALRVLEQRARYRAGRTDSLASVNELSDLTSGELATFKRFAAKQRTRKQPQVATLTIPTTTTSPELPEAATCCDYDQVYRRLIELLNRTSGTDAPLAKAIAEELQQIPLFPTTTEELSSSESDAEALEMSSNEEDANANANAQVTGTGTESEVAASEQRQQQMAALAESVRRQLAQQLSPESPLAKQLERQYSALFETPVSLKATIGAAAHLEQRQPEGARRLPVAKSSA